jgi:DNA modification methylase
MNVEVMHGDCLEVLPTLAANSADAGVTDPPYGLRLMGKHWDHGVPGVAFWTEALRLLKPGARLLAFGGTRTYHRMACAIEDAGFEIEDSLCWLYGSGFPKHKSKLKPAHEPIVMARKPAPKATPLNVDACRLGEPRTTHAAGNIRTSDNTGVTMGTGFGLGIRPAPSGRWPANVVLGCACDSNAHDPTCAAAMLDAQSGERPGMQPGILRRGATTGRSIGGSVYGTAEPQDVLAGYGDTGGASRFYYVAKASRSEREAGLQDAPRRNGGSNAKGFTDDVARGLDRNRPVANHHPTVKPVALMRWLVRLVTPPDGLVLDPFCGSGTTGIAATLEGRRFLGIEREAEYVEIARARIAHHAPTQTELGVA